MSIQRCPEKSDESHKSPTKVKKKMARLLNFKIKKEEKELGSDEL